MRLQVGVIGMDEYIKSDLYRYMGDTSAFSFLKAYFRIPAFRYQVAFRMVNSKGVKKLWGGVMWLLRNKRNIQLPKNTKVGYGLYIGHNGPIVINPTTVIGNNVNLSQFTTIGSNKGNAAQIGDNVYIGPNVCIVENVKIGDNATIGAGSVVTKDIPENATAVGNYARVINYDNAGVFIQNRWNALQ